MADDILQEFDADTLKTTAKSLGSRVRDAALATAGKYVGRGGEATGRLYTRTIADRMLQGWLTYKGASGKTPTRANIYQFLRKHYGRDIDDGQLRELVGLPATANNTPNGSSPNANPSNANPSNAEAPDPRQGEMFQQNQMNKPSGGTQANAQPASGSAQPTTPTGTPAAPTAAQPASTPATAPATTPTEPAAAAPATAPEAPTPRPVIRSIADIQRQDQVSPTKANEIQQTEIGAFGDWQQADKAKAKTAATVAPAAAPQPVAPPVESTPAQPTVPTPPVAPTAPEAPAAPQTAPSPAAQPTATAPTQPAVQPSQPNPAPQQPQTAPAPASIATRDGWQAFKSNMSSLVRQPQPDPAAVMRTLANALRQTRKGTPERQRMMNYIGGLQTNWKIANKIPQLRQIPMENFQPYGRILWEDANDVLPRSAIDKIFVSIAQTMVAHRAESERNEGDDEGDEDDTDEIDNQSDNNDRLETYYNRVITVKNMVRAQRAIHPSPSEMRSAGKIVMDKLEAMNSNQKHVTLKELLDGLRKDGRKIDRLPKNIMDMLIDAAKADH